MRKVGPRRPDRNWSGILWQVAEDNRVPPPVRAQLREIARDIDTGQYRIGIFAVR